ncbi:hypothetical protein PM082_018412 [Marasmius tenuissimus]|nr:hypothetical protein PM082_018399 [Marasmius tenuissimus]KAJ8089836.1 hypothetical protein PM082_018412 [Marasmius tenuissimus]
MTVDLEKFKAQSIDDANAEIATEKEEIRTQPLASESLSPTPPPDKPAHNKLLRQVPESHDTRPPARKDIDIARMRRDVFNWKLRVRFS